MMVEARAANWIGIDWGTSNLRGWAMRDTQTLDRAQSGDEMATLSRDGFAPALARLTGAWGVPDDTPVIACGMVGARQGWVEAPYRAVPCTPLASGFGTASDEARSIHIIPGLKQAHPADVMRGEETQIAGFLALNPGWDGVICLPGTHTKWVQVSAGEVVSFQTYMSGELFALLSRASVLRHSTQGDGWDDDAFADAIGDSLSKPEKLAARLFSIRAANLLDGTPDPVSRSRLSGLLIGAELAAARPYWLGQNIALVGGRTQAMLYASALEAQGVPATVADGERMTLAGLTAAWRHWKETA